MFLSFLLLIGIYRTSDASDLLDLTKENETYVKRFLHPLPHEIRFKGVAYRFPLNNCFIASAPGTALGKQIIDDFKVRLKRRFGISLN